MAKNIRKRKINDKDISFLNRDFESFRNELIRYSRVHYGTEILDFSESSLAGMFVDMAAYVGDVLSFYQDHQLSELSLETASETKNIERLIRQSGVKIKGASPSFVEIDITIKVPAAPADSNGNIAPNSKFLPEILAGSIFSSKSGIDFELMETVDFNAKDNEANLLASQVVASVNSASEPTNFFLTLRGICTSSKSATETFVIPDTFSPFRTITLKNSDVSEVISVKDSINDEYFEVENLTQDTVFKRNINTLPDFLSVPERISMIPAPKRFQLTTDRQTRKSTLRFGAGNEDIFDEDVVPDPSEHAVKLFGDRKTLPFITIDPNSFLTTNTLGVSPKNTTLTVKYRHGGGVSHNVAPGLINSVKTLITKFPSGMTSSQISNIRSSTTCNNLQPALGGENPLTLGELRQIALSSRNAQGRIVTKEDLLGRVYSMPDKFGRVFRAGVRENPFNPFASHLHVISRDNTGKLTLSSDSLKQNLSTFLEHYRLITDAIDIVDAIIINIGFEYEITVESTSNPVVVVQSVNFKLQEYFDIKNYQIDQPIILSEIQNIILNTAGVVSLMKADIISKSGVVNLNSYNVIDYQPQRNTDRGILYPLPGGIFEVKFPNDDILGTVR